MSFATLLALLLAAALPQAPAAQQQLPDAFVGEWRGRIADQRDGGDVFVAVVRLDGGRVGEKVGSVEYPDYDCGGNLYLVETRGWQVVVRERLTYGTDRCIDQGRILFSRPEDRPRIMYEWSGSGVTAVGVLERQR